MPLLGRVSQRGSPRPSTWRTLSAGSRDSAMLSGAATIHDRAPSVPGMASAANSIPVARAIPGSIALAASPGAPVWRRASSSAAVRGSRGGCRRGRGRQRQGRRLPRTRRGLGLLQQIHEEAGAADAHHLDAGRLDRQEALVLTLVAGDLEDDVGLGLEDLHGVLDDLKLEALRELAPLGTVARVGDDGDRHGRDGPERLDGVDEVDPRPDQPYLVRATRGRWHGAIIRRGP